MTTETLTVFLGDFEDEDTKVKGKDLVAGDEDDNQIVTILDATSDGEDDGDGFDGGTLLFEFWGKDAPEDPGAGPGGDDLFGIDLSGFDDDFHIDVQSMDAGDAFRISGWDSKSVEGTTHRFHYTGKDGGDYTMSIDAQSRNGETGIDVVQVLCFCRGTRIGTPEGETAIEDLHIGDLVTCADGIDRPLRWIGRRRLTAQTLAANPHLRPVRFAPGTLGGGLPRRDLRLSPQHRVRLEDGRAEVLFGEAEVLVPARALVNGDGIRTEAAETGVEYYHLLLDSHQVVHAEGAPCETLMPAEMARTAMSAEARAEILAIFPDLAADLRRYGPTRHRALRPFEAEVLLTPPE